jgi:hypothetical protein
MLNDLLLRLRSLFQRKVVEAEIDDELRFHFEKQVSKFIESGMQPEEARRLARLEFGGMEQVKEEHRDARGVSFFETLLQDVRYGLRILGRTPVITSVAILSLALGIGANTAIFSMMDAVMLRLLPVRNPQELVQVRIRSFKSGTEAGGYFTNPLWEQLRDRQDVFSNAFAWSEHRLISRRAGQCNTRTDCASAVEFLKHSVFGPWPGACCWRQMTSGDAPGLRLSAMRSGRIATAEPRV